ncbi:MAG: hypothetical protein WKF37_11100 [Bryobacteraceae bacterium]
MDVDQASEFLTWREGEQGAAVRLDRSVIERINVDVMRGFGVTRRRGTEAGGILLGSIAGQTVTVVDYYAVACEYAYGPSYILSDSDSQLFREAVERFSSGPEDDKRPVGYFRSHTRDGFELDENDTAIFTRHFRHPGQLILLVKPYVTKSNTAAIFIPANGKVPTGVEAREFPFAKDSQFVVAPVAPILPQAPPIPVAPILPQAPPTPVEPLEPVKPAAPVVEAVEPEAATTLPAGMAKAAAAYDLQQAASPLSWRTRLAWVLFTLCAMAFGAVGGLKYAGIAAPGKILSGGANPAAAEDPFATGLTAKPQDQGILIEWNSASPAIARALRGSLFITEGNATKEVKLGFPSFKTDPCYIKTGRGRWALGWRWCWPRDAL